MADFIIVNGDKAQFIQVFGAAIVVVNPFDMIAGGKSTINGNKVCVQGDESSVQVPGCAYTTASHSIPGVGTVKILALGGDQLAKKNKDSGKPLLLKGTIFQASFEVQTPAQLPPPVSSPDPVPMYPGMGMFTTTNSLVKGT